MPGKILGLAAMLALCAAGGVTAQDAMSTDAMGTMGTDDMGVAGAPKISDADLATCRDEAAAISFAAVAMAARQACQALYDGQDGMGGASMMSDQAM